LQDELPSQQFNTWIKPLQIDEAASPNELRLLAPNRFISNWVEEKFLNRIKELVGHYQEGTTLSVVVAVGAKPQAAFQTSVFQSSPSVAVASNAPVYKDYKDQRESVAEAVPEVEAAPVVRQVIERAYRPLEEPRIQQEAEVEGGLKHSNYLTQGRPLRLLWKVSPTS